MREGVSDAANFGSAVLAAVPDFSSTCSGSGRALSLLCSICPSSRGSCLLHSFLLPLGLSVVLCLLWARFLCPSHCCPCTDRNWNGLSHSKYCPSASLTKGDSRAKPPMCPSAHCRQRSCPCLCSCLSSHSFPFQTVGTCPIPCSDPNYKRQARSTIVR